MLALGCHSTTSLLCSDTGQDQDWSAIAAVQCRLDREGATKLVADLIMNTKNEKIFQESILLAIRLLDGGNTEIQVLRGIGQPGVDVGRVRVQCSAPGSGFGQNTSCLCWNLMVWVSQLHGWMKGWRLWEGQVVPGCFWSSADALCREFLKWLRAAALVGDLQAYPKSSVTGKLKNCVGKTQ